MVHTQGCSVLYVGTERIFFVQKLLGGPKISKLGHVTQATPIWGSFCGPDAAEAVIYVCAKFEADISIRSKVIRGVAKFRNLVT